MLSIILILIFSGIILTLYLKPQKITPKNQNNDEKVKKLWSIAQTSMREKKTVRAEKALLTILKIDEKNAAAYNRLGILYAKNQKWEESIECFEIAQSIDNNPSSLHNMGLIYLEIKAYEKAVIAFTQALKLEGGIPARHLALAKAEEKLGHYKIAIENLEQAFELDRSVSTLRQILSIYETLKDEEQITHTTARIESELATKNIAKTKPKISTSKPVISPKITKPRRSDSVALVPKAPKKKPTFSKNLRRRIQ